MLRWVFCCWGFGIELVGSACGVKGRGLLSSGAPAEPEAVGGSGSSGGVVNLGVVGRGSKRITLQPTPAEGGAAVAASGTSHHTSRMPPQP